MQTGVVGVNHKTAQVGHRERMAQLYAQLQDQLSDYFDSYVVLATCNRIEIYFHSLFPEKAAYAFCKRLEAEWGCALSSLYVHTREAALHHLIRVASGLDSALLLETEIQGQVKKAYGQAMIKQQLSKELHFLFQKGLKIAKSLRSHHSSAQEISSLQHLVVAMGEREFKVKNSCRILLVGASQTNQKIAELLQKKQWPQPTLCNRTQTSRPRFHWRNSLRSLAWEHLQEWVNYDWVIVATRSPDILLRPEALGQLPEKKLLIDLSVPRNIAPLNTPRANLSLYNIDTLPASLSPQPERQVAYLESLALWFAQKETERFFQKSCAHERYSSHGLFQLSEATNSMIT